MPCPTPFVVKNGSKIFSITSGGHAGAGVGDFEQHVLARLETLLAGISGFRLPVTLAVRIESLPPSGMASRALTARFTITCSSWFRSALIGQTSRP